MSVRPKSASHVSRDQVAGVCDDRERNGQYSSLVAQAVTACPLVPTFDVSGFSCPHLPLA